jgi:hypothetical protein
MAHNALHKNGLDQTLDDGREDQSGRDDHQDRGEGRPVTFDQFDTTNFLIGNNKADGSASEQFILQINGVERNGAHVSLPGLGSDFGMYFIIDATLLPANGGPPNFSQLDIKLMVDPGNNDGAVSATTAGVGFANGTGGDFALATGTLVSAALAINADPLPNTRHANFVEQLTPTEAGREAFGDSLTAGDQLRELLTTLGSNPPLNVIPLPGGDSTTLVNGATGTAQLVSQQSMRLSVGELMGDHGASWMLGGHSG